MRFAEKLKRSGKAARSRSSKIKATRVLAVGFLAVIAIGTACLMLPIATADGKNAPFLTALFTSVSSTCVTGLSVVDTATYWSRFGHVIIILMIQTGGLGFMTFAVLISRIIKKMLTPKDRMIVAMSYNLNSYAGVSELVKSILIGTATIEGLGAVILFTRFKEDFSLGDAIFRSIFTSISAFCNAGFDLAGDLYETGVDGISYGSSIGYYATDPAVLITLTLLITLGGIGFIVWFDIKERVLHKKKLPVYTKLVLLVSSVLLFAGAIIFAALEWNNFGTIGYMSTGDKIVASLFHSASLRTAGFAIFNNGSMGMGAQMLSIVLMFIGGASGSTAGGVKVVTVGVLVYTVWCNVRGKKEAIIFGRRISPQSFIRAATVIFVQICLAILGTGVISVLSRDAEGMPILYEVVSAVSTVGLSMGITASLGAASQMILMLLMYFGRVGILTVTYSLMLSQSSSDSSIKYPDADLLIG